MNENYFLVVAAIGIGLQGKITSKNVPLWSYNKVNYSFCLAVILIFFYIKNRYHIATTQPIDPTVQKRKFLMAMYYGSTPYKVL
jgi:hypothetical protein